MAHLTINALKISVDTEEGLYGAEFSFVRGLNVLRAHNTRGKSSSMNSILYALGVEELLGGTNEKSMKPVLKDELIYKGNSLTVLESNVQLEITNIKGETITITRWIKSPSINPKLIKVENGPSLTQKTSFESKDYYVHLKGAAVEHQGFHHFLAKFLKWDLPLVPTFEGKDRVLYLQSLFPYFYIEQLKGWTSFYAPLPSNFGIRELSKRAFEFLLNLDVISNSKEYEELKIQHSILTTSWNAVVKNIKALAVGVNGTLENLPEKPSLLIEPKINLVEEDGGVISLEEKMASLLGDVLSEEQKTVRRIKDVEDQNEQEIKELEFIVLAKQDFVNSLKREIALEKGNQQTMEENLIELEEDLVKNQEVQKLYSLGSTIDIHINKGICPTCNQHIQDTLLPQQINYQPLDLNENIVYIKEQINAIKFGIKQSKSILENKMIRLRTVEEQLINDRKKIRILKSELKEDPRMPTRQDIEKIIERKILYHKLNETSEKFEYFSEEIKTLKEQWRSYLVRKEKLNGEYFSNSDKKKISQFERLFKQYAEDFEYSSVSVDDITISRDKYTPLVKEFDIKFDSSASDNIRLIWAYTCALAETSFSNGGNHPNLIMMDEPGQQQMDTDSQEALFKALSNINSQVIVASSLKRNELQDITEGIEINVIDLGEDYIIKPIQENHQ